MSLGLLAFILAFTFGMTTSRFDQRRQLVLDESNAISGAYLSTTLDESLPFRQIRHSLREYLELRLGVTKQNFLSEWHAQTSYSKRCGDRCKS